jgi:nucleoside-diphosphate-sugar epimerase
MSKVVITGASGLIGTRLTEMLVERGYEVAHLGRTKKSGKIETFVWDIEKGIVDDEAFKNISAVIHLD